MANSSERSVESFTERTPRIVSASKLHRSAARRKQGRFLVEGFNSVDAAVRAGAVEEIFVTEDAADRFPDLLDQADIEGFPISFVTDKAASSLAETVTTTGLFAVCPLDSVDAGLGEILDRVDRTPVPVIVVGVETSDPGNAGTIIRMADALGAAGVVFAGDTVDPAAGKTVRSSAGSIFHLPVVRERDADVVLDALRERGIPTLATAMGGELALGTDPLPDGPVAWLLGNEAHGLPEDILAGADHRVSIPIFGRAESLNLATASAMCLWESARGR